MVRNLVSIGIVAALLLLAGVALFRPATLFGVDSKALANSVGSELEHSHAKCISGMDGWRCQLTGGSAVGAEYMVRTHRFGCWTGSQVRRPRAADRAQQSVTGCIGLTDLFGH